MSRGVVIDNNKANLGAADPSGLFFLFFCFPLLLLLFFFIRARVIFFPQLFPSAQLIDVSHWERIKCDNPIVWLSDRT